MPRTVKHPPFIQYFAPTVWTTLVLTIHADGTHEAAMVGASGFPRHWVYDNSGALVAKSSVAEYKKWMNDSYGRRTPWGDEDSPALVTAVETQLERQLQEGIMRGGTRPDIRRVKEGKILVEQGSESKELFLLLNGVLVVEVDGEPLAEVGPARCSANGPCSKAAAAPPPCVPSQTARSPPLVTTTSIRPSSHSWQTDIGGRTLDRSDGCGSFRRETNRSCHPVSVVSNVCLYQRPDFGLDSGRSLTENEAGVESGCLIRYGRKRHRC